MALCVHWPACGTLLCCAPCASQHYSGFEAIDLSTADDKCVLHVVGVAVGQGGPTVSQRTVNSLMQHVDAAHRLPIMQVLLGSCCDRSQPAGGCVPFT